MAHGEKNVRAIPYKQNQLKYMHQSMFRPPIATLIKAVDNYFHERFPFMKSKLVLNYLAKYSAMAKERTKRPHKGIIIMIERSENRVIYAIPTIEYKALQLIPDE